MEFKFHSLLDFPTMLFLIFGARSKNNLRGYVAFSGNTIKKLFEFYECYRWCSPDEINFDLSPKKTNILYVFEPCSDKRERDASP